LSTSQVILSIAYFPPVQYFSKLINYDLIHIEKFENYSKQSYRNRCEILSTAGLQTLSIPIEKKSGEKQPVKDIKIDNALNWQSSHFKSIQTAYFSSPFYEYYADAIIPFFKKQYAFLFDLNIAILETLFNEMQFKKVIQYTDRFQKHYPFTDHRYSIHPKADQGDDKEFNPVKYTQVFFNKFEFVPNLSILDLLFNEGPNTIDLLESTYIKQQP
jgi:hypothetical protein